MLYARHYKDTALLTLGSMGSMLKVRQKVIFSTVQTTVGFVDRIVERFRVLSTSSAPDETRSKLDGIERR